MADYIIEKLPHEKFTQRLQRSRISGSLIILPPEEGQSPGLRASSLPSCQRQVGYRLFKTPISDDTYKEEYQLKADIGTAIHVRIQEQLVDMGMAYQDPISKHYAIEWKIEEHANDEDTSLLFELGFKGHFDALLEGNNGELILFDIKTVDGPKMKKGYPFLNKKLQGYAIQLSSYLRFLTLPDGRKATQAYVYMIDRWDTNKRALYRIPWQPERWAEDENRLKAASKAILSNELPVAEFEIGPCNLCSWATKCRKEHL